MPHKASAQGPLHLPVVLPRPPPWPLVAKDVGTSVAPSSSSASTSGVATISPSGGFVSTPISVDLIKHGHVDAFRHDLLQEYRHLEPLVSGDWRKG